MTITYDTPIEVTKNQHDFLMLNFREIVAGQQSNGKWYIKVWAMRYAEQIKRVLADPKLK